MKFNYHEYGDILYGVETFRFRFKGQETADVTLLNLLDDNKYAYDIRMTDKYVPNEFKIISSADYSLIESLNIEPKSVFNSKQEALQHAIDVMSAVMIKNEGKENS